MFKKYSSILEDTSAYHEILSVDYEEDKRSVVYLLGSECRCHVDGNLDLQKLTKGGVWLLKEHKLRVVFLKLRSGGSRRHRNMNIEPTKQ